MQADNTPWQPPPSPHRNQTTLTDVLCFPCTCLLNAPINCARDCCELGGAMATSAFSAFDTGEERPTHRVVIGTVQPPMQVRM